MAAGDKWYDYSVLTTGDTFSNGETTKPVALGATQAILSNGALTVNADGPAGLKAKSLAGTTQSVSGTTYIEESISATGVISITIKWKMPSSVGTIGGGFFWCGNGSTRIAAFSLLSTEQIRFFSASGGTLFTSTYSGGFVYGQWYVTKFHITQGTTSSNGRLVSDTFLDGSTSALSGCTYDSGATINMGTTASQINRVRHGTRAATGTADEDLRVRMGYNPTTAMIMDEEPPPTTDATVNAVRAQITVTAVVVSPSLSAEVGPPAATVSVTPLVPSVPVGQVVVAVRAQVTVAAGTPSASAGGTVTGVRAQVSSTAPASSVTASSTVTAVAATVSVAAAAPSLSISHAVAATVATVEVTAVPVIVSAGVATSVTATLATIATAALPASSVTASSAVAAVRAIVTVTAAAPVGSGSSVVLAVPSTLAAVAYTVTVAGGPRPDLPQRRRLVTSSRRFTLRGGSR